MICDKMYQLHSGIVVFETVLFLRLFGLKILFGFPFEAAETPKQQNQKY